MNVFRLCRQKYKNDLTGKGAEISGGRWNSKGTPMIYTAQSRALCTVELAVHLSLGSLPRDYVMLTIHIPDEIEIKKLSTGSLPADWQSHPHSDSTQSIGDMFIDGNMHIVMQVPSVVVRGDFNFLINPLHPEISTSKLVNSEKFTFDTRLFY